MVVTTKLHFKQGALKRGFKTCPNFSRETLITNGFRSKPNRSETPSLHPYVLFYYLISTHIYIYTP